MKHHRFTQRKRSLSTAVGRTGCCVLLLLLAAWCCTGCGSGAYAPSSSAVPLVLKTPRSGFNRMTVSVQVCIPDTATCETIPDILVDTGSVGLRLQKSALPADLAGLPAQEDTSGGAVNECFLFGSGGAWGTERLADVTIGHAHASAMRVQIVDAASPQRPANCSAGPVTSNGTLGLGIEQDDCTQNSCKMPEAYGPDGTPFSAFYTCGHAGCTPLLGVIPAQYHLPNPLTRLDGGYNGILIDLPALPAQQADQLTGTLTFGVNLGSDNRMTRAEVVPLGPRGRMTTTYNGISSASSYFDAGTPALQVPTSEFTGCTAPLPSHAFCEQPSVSRTATVTGADGVPHTVSFAVGMYPGSGASSVAAYNSIASPNFVWGAPFFIGRRVAMVRIGQLLPGSHFAGPLYAWQASTIP